MQKIERETPDLLEQGKKIERAMIEFIESIDADSIEKEYQAEFMAIGENQVGSTKDEVLEMATELIRKMLIVDALNEKDEPLYELNDRPPKPVEVLEVLNIITTRNFTEEEIINYLYRKRYSYTNGKPDVPFREYQTYPLHVGIVKGMNILLEGIEPGLSMVTTDRIKMKYPFEFLAEV